MDSDAQRGRSREAAETRERAFSSVGACEVDPSDARAERMRHAITESWQRGTGALGCRLARVNF